MSEHSEVKVCPNCKGDGYEDNPPMRKCGICKGAGKVWEKGTTPNRREGQNQAHGANAGRKNTICSAHQGQS